MGVEVVADGVNPWVVGVTVADGLSLKTVKDQSFQGVHRQRFRQRRGCRVMAYHFVEQIAQLLELFGIVNGCFADTVSSLVPL